MGLPGLPATKRGLQLVAMRESWGAAQGREGEALARPRKARGGGTEYHLTLLPEGARARLAAPARAQAPTPAERDASRESAWARFERLPGSLKDEARRRLKLLQEVEDLERAGLGKGRAIDTVVLQKRRLANLGEGEAVSTGTVYAWFKRVAGVEAHDRLAFLAPDYVGRTATAECHDEALLLFKSEYLTNSCQSAAAAHRKTQTIGVSKGWAVPSCKALVARLEREVSPQTIVFLREGHPGLERKFPTPKRDISGLRVLQAVNVDGHKVDVMVKWADGTVGRPMMIGIQDIYSRRMLATTIGVSESVDLVRRAFAHVFTHHGVPEDVLFDNGRAFASKWLTGGTPNRFRFKVKDEDPVGMLPALGCTIHFANPYSGRSKPIERAFGDFCDGLARSAVFQGAYTGPNTSEKPADYGTTAVPIDVFLKELDFFVAQHNAQLGRRTQMAAGKLSFDQVWQEGLDRGHLVRRATPEQLRMALLAAEGVTVRRGTCQLHLADNVYWSEALWAYEGQKVIVRFDPEDLHAPLHVYDLAQKYIGEVPCVQAIGFFSAEAAKDVGRAKAKIIRAARDSAEAQRLHSARKLAGLRPAAEAPVFEEGSNVLAPVFGTRGALALAPQSDPRELHEAQVVDLHARAMDRLAGSIE